MGQINNMKIYFPILVFSFIHLFIVHIQADEIYKWVDNIGTIHFTNNMGNIPKEVIGSSGTLSLFRDGTLQWEHTTFITKAKPLDEKEANEQSLRQKLLRRRLKEESIKKFWRNSVLDIENRKKTLIQNVEIMQKQALAKKREIDNLLISGYFADRSILELRQLNDNLEKLVIKLSQIEPQRQQLKEEARRRGIPPEYLTP